MSAKAWGLALGSGAAKGWAHIGVLQALEKEGLRPDVVAGTSMGALVGSVYCAGGLDKLQESAVDLNIASVFFYVVEMGPHRSGLLEGDRVLEFIEKHLPVTDFDALSIPFRCVATDLLRGEAVEFSRGELLPAVRASISIPGLFTPVYRDGLVLVDGGVVNPLPVDVARAMGAEVVVAVDLNPGAPHSPVARTAPLHMLDKIRVRVARTRATKPDLRWLARIEERIQALDPERLGWVKSILAPDPVPHLLEVIDTSMMILEGRVTKLNLMEHPADLLLQPRADDITIMDFHRAGDAIEAGRRAVEPHIDTIRRLVGDNSGV